MRCRYHLNSILIILFIHRLTAQIKMKEILVRMIYPFVLSCRQNINFISELRYNIIHIPGIQSSKDLPFYWLLIDMVCIFINVYNLYLNYILDSSVYKINFHMIVIYYNNYITCYIFWIISFIVVQVLFWKGQHYWF